MEKRAVWAAPPSDGAKPPGIHTSGLNAQKSLFGQIYVEHPFKQEANMLIVIDLRKISQNQMFTISFSDHMCMIYHFKL